MPSETTINWLFNDVYYLSIAWFDWKISVFQQAVVKFYYILKLFTLLQFKHPKWVLDYSKIGRYCGIKSFSVIVKYHPSFPFVY